MSEQEKTNVQDEADCEEMAEMASKYGYDILCDDGVNEIAVMPGEDEADPNCDRAAKLVKRFGYDVVCGIEEEE